MKKKCASCLNTEKQKSKGGVPKSSSVKNSAKYKKGGKAKMKKKC